CQYRFSLLSRPRPGDLLARNSGIGHSIMWTLRRQRQRLKSEHSHSPEAIARRLDRGPGHNYLRDFIYGAIDGAITTFAIVSGVAGAGLSSGVVIVMGLANLLADGFSM